MGTLFLTTILSCSQVLSIANRLLAVGVLSQQQKTEILLELRKAVPSCPLIVKPNDSKRTPGT